MYNPPPCICTRVCVCVAGGAPFEDQTQGSFTSQRASKQRKKKKTEIWCCFCGWWLDLFKRTRQHAASLSPPPFTSNVRENWWMKRPAPKPSQQTAERLRKQLSRHMIGQLVDHPGNPSTSTKTFSRWNHSSIDNVRYLLIPASDWGIMESTVTAVWIHQC